VITALSKKEACSISVIDIGTNSVLMLIAGMNQKRQLVSRKQMTEITRLGRNLKSTHRIGSEGLKATIETVNRYREISAQHEADRVNGVGTHVFRAAENRSEALSRILLETGLPVEILTEEEEAAYSFQGALRGRSFGEAIVIDIGGGSTELTLGNRDRIREWISIPMGAVTGTEEFLKGDPPARRYCMKFQKKVARQIPSRWKEHLGSIPSILCTGGTATTLAAMTLRLKEYDAGRVDGTWLPPEQIRECLDRLCSVSLKARQEMILFDPKRADIIIGGALILLALVESARGTVMVSDRGLRHGIALREFGIIPSVPSRTG
jgi:exopolyphosphatase/guanosine-5'-triphosphate,3'-diphosphate pyrophosphatase